MESSAGIREPGREKGTGRPEGSRARELWAASARWAEACLQHPFVRGIASGDLPRERFAFYVGQDAYYLTAFARAYALAVAKAPDRDGMLGFHGLLDGALGELKLHKGYAARWGIRLDPEPAPATQAYTDFLLRVAWSEPVGRIAAAMTPCMRLYAYLGQALRPHLNPASPYREWVETYASDEFEALARRLEDLVDRYDDGAPETAAYYQTAMRLEYEFFDQAWRWSG
ncbi:MAG: TenA family protein [Bacillota bacterium]|nr:TenA family protein [Bacillota bacterium]PZN40841.1 MAG: TenA family transcriptional regulator [Bacillota bacterium]